MNKTLLLLSAGLILSTLAGCGGNASSSASTEGGTSAAEQTSQGQDTSEDESQKVGKVIIAENEETAELYGLKVLKSDIAIDDVVNLEESVQVTGVNSWSIESKSENISIEGHTFKALDYGAYKITLVAGKTRRAINGYVVTPTKLAFNEKFAGLSTHEYMIGGEYTGTMIVNDAFWGEMGTLNNEAVITGGITDPSTKATYSYNLPVTVDKSGAITEFGSELQMNKGFGRSVEDKGFFEAFETVSFRDFIQQFDEEGFPTGYFILENDEPNEYNESLVSNWYNSLVGDDVWENLVDLVTGDYTTQMNLAARYNSTTDVISLYPAGTDGHVYTSFTYDGEKYKAATEISSIGDTSLEATDKWLANPVIPESIDIGELRDKFTSIFTAKAYTLKAEASWVNLTTGAAIEVPNNFKREDGDEVFSNYETEVHMNENLAETVYVSTSQAAYLPDEDYVIPANGTREINFVHNNYFCSATFDPATQEWGAVSQASDPFSDTGEGTIWDSTMVPYVFGDDFSYDILALASIYDVQETEDGTFFAYNTYGLDMALGLSEYYAGIPYFFAAMTPSMLAYIPIFYLAYLDWYNYSTMGFLVGEDSVSFTILFQASSTLGYVMSWSFENIGVDSVSDDAKQVYQSYVNPALPE